MQPLRAVAIKQQIDACRPHLTDATFLERCKSVVTNGFPDETPIGDFKRTANPSENILARICLLRLLAAETLNKNITMNDPDWFRDSQQKLLDQLNRPIPRLTRAQENTHLFFEGCGILLLLQLFRHIAKNTNLDFTKLNLALLFYILVALNAPERLTPLSAIARTYLFPNEAQVDAQQLQALRSFLIAPVNIDNFMINPDDLRRLSNIPTL